MRHFKQLLTCLGLLLVSLNLFAQTNTCLPPTGLTATNITTSSAVLSWTPSNTVNQYYTVQYRPTGNANWMIVTVQQFPYTMNNLLCGTNYEWQVQAYCLNPNGVATSSGYSSPTNFTTSACSNTCIAPTGLSVSGITTNSSIITWNAVSGATGYNIRYRMAGAAAWLTTTSTTNTITLGNLTCGSNYEVAVQTICTSASSSVFSAPITFSTSPCTTTCLPPAGLSAANITSNSAVLSWTVLPGTGYSYDIRYRVVGSTNLIGVSNIAPPYTLANLACNTNFEFQVRTNCGNNNYSAWSTFVAFTTNACPTNCPTPTGLTSTNITSSSAVLSWSSVSPTPVGYNLRFRVLNTTSWTTVNNVSSPYQAAGLPCNVGIEWQVQTICTNATGAASLSAWSGSALFTTAACTSPCPAPIGLTTTNITANAATANWSAVTGAPGYTIRRRVVGSATWSYFTTTAISFNFGNLTCGTNYEWQVRANCAVSSNTNVNPYSPSSTFTTTSCPTTCPAPTQLTNTNITTNSAVLGWSNTSAFQYRVRYRVNVTGSLWTYLITSNTNTTLTNLTSATSYVWQVQSICSNTSSTANIPWSVTATFQTLSTSNACPPPSNISFATTTSPGSVLLNWSATPTAVSYTIRYRPANSASWLQAGTTNTNIPINNLTPGTAYEFQIRAVCATSNGTTVTGIWSASYFYTTPLLLTVYPNPANTTATLDWISDSEGRVEISLRDVFGQLARNLELLVQPGLNRIEISVSDLKEGWYSATISSNQQVSAARLLISRP
ncbi:MAG: fibronectin type III domain-containing protein [Bacteroidota bacterium]